MGGFYIEAIEATQIALVKVGSPTIGTVHYGVDDTSVPNVYTVTTSGTPISLSAGQKCYWTVTSTSTDFSSSKYLKFTSTGRVNVGGDIHSLIDGSIAIPRNYCFYGLFYNCSKLVDASLLLTTNLEFNRKTDCFSGAFYGCTSLKNPPMLRTLELTSGCYAGMFYGCTSLKLSAQQTGNYKIPYRIPIVGQGTEIGGKDSSMRSMFANTGGTFTGTPKINTTYYLWQDSTPVTVNYKGQQLSAFDTGSKTLNCDGKYMEDDVVVTRESGTAIITYNGTQIATVTDGSKTLLCAGKVMSGNVTIEADT